MDYFYCPPAKIDKTQVVIEGEEFSHLIHVMRKKVGDEIRVVDGCGTAYDVTLTGIRRKTALGTIVGKDAGYNEPDVALTIGVGILKNPSKFDFLVEKTTELGVREIVPLRTERTIPSHAKADRWQKLALAAMKQSGRAFLPQVSELTDLEDFLAAGRSASHRLVAHEKITSYDLKTPLPLMPGEDSAIVLIGPEGGFTDQEFDRCVAAGYRQIYMGGRRLRTETAAIVLTALILLSGSAIDVPMTIRQPHRPGG